MYQIRNTLLGMKPYCRQIIICPFIIVFSNSKFVYPSFLPQKKFSWSLRFIRDLLLSDAFSSRKLFLPTSRIAFSLLTMGEGAERVGYTTFERYIQIVLFSGHLFDLALVMTYLNFACEPGLYFQLRNTYILKITTAN